MVDVQSPVLSTLMLQFRMNQWIAGRNTAGLTQEESEVRAVPDGNHISWLLRHVVATRNAVLPALRQSEQPLSADMTLEELLAAFDGSQERVLAGLGSLSDDDLAGEPPFTRGTDPETLGTLLAKIAIHEAYHLGQTGLLRRVAGKEGAIR